MRCATISIFRLFSAITALVALICLVAPSRADEAIRWKFKVGEKLGYNMTQDMNLTMNMGANGQLNNNVHQVMDMTWDVQGVNDEGEAVIEQSFDRVQMKVTGPMDVDYDSSKDAPVTGLAASFAPLYKAMTKSPFEVTMTARGEIKDVKVPQDVLDTLKSSPGAAQMGDLATPEGFQKMIMQGSFTLPENTPEKGDHWSTNVSISNPVGGKQTVETTYTYEGPKDVNGETYAVFRPALKMSFEGTPQLKMTVKEQKSDGEVLFNEQAGRLDSMTLKQDVTMEVVVAAQTLQQQINQNIQVKVTPKDVTATTSTDEKSAK